ncbi:MAG: hypothetical protein KTR17_09950 [Cellvibrionaceae bacterium]|nr:hypothetical protein [Cellvibrionaceae bacterium]
MHNKRKVLNISEHLAKQRVRTPIVGMDIYQLLQKANVSAGLPISVCINGDRLQAIQQLSLSPCTLLSSEIKLWTEIIGRRAVDNFLFCFPFQALQPFELTQIMHTLASRFSLSQSAQRVHRVVTSQDEINPQHIALLKGLGFNHYQVVVKTGELDNLQHLKSKVQLIRRYTFQGISLLIRKTSCLGNLRAQIIDIQQQIAPDFISIGHQPKLSDLSSYSCSDTIIFEEESEPLNNSLGLGPEGVSRFCNTQLQNFCKAEAYTEALQQNQLPLSTVNDNY